jgi:hypothetical protein
MSGEEFILAIVGVTAGTALVGYTVAKITGLIKMWMEQHHDRKTKSQVPDEWRQFMQQTNRRLQNLETIVAEDRPAALEEPKDDLTQEIEFPEQEEAPTRQTQSSSGDSRLSNMLD